MKKYLVVLGLILCTLLTLASCKDKEATLLYHANGALFHLASYTEGERVQNPAAVPEREGYVFNGWYYDEGVWEKPFDPADLNYTFRAGTHKLYARFEHVSFVQNADGAGYTVTGALAGLGEELVIPAKYLGKPVTAIAERAFQNNAHIRAVHIPDSVTYIGQYAFSGCRALLEVTLPNATGLAAGKGVFSFCTALESVNMGATLKEIPAYSFEGCTVLRSVTVYQAERILGGAFKNCTALAEITLPASMKKIESRAFEGCTSLGAVHLSRNTEEIGENAFLDCHALATLSFDGESGLRVLGKGALSDTAIASLSLPSLINLGENALPETLESLRFGNKNLMYVGASAFASLKEGTTVIYGSTLEEFESAVKHASWSEGRVVTIVCENGQIAP